MNTLFPIEDRYPEGFSYTPDFISPAEEVKLCEFISKIKLSPFIFQGYKAKRKVASFGYDWNFENRMLAKGAAIPAAFDELMEKVVNSISLQKQQFAELLVTEYPAGAVINWHRDAPPFDLIAGISLQSDCTFRLRPYAKPEGKAGVISVLVKRRSLYIMQGAARTDWQHSILPVKGLRYSITLRTLKTDDVPFEYCFYAAPA